MRKRLIDAGACCNCRLERKATGRGWRHLRRQLFIDSISSLDLLERRHNILDRSAAEQRSAWYLQILRVSATFRALAIYTCKKHTCPDGHSPFSFKIPSRSSRKTEKRRAIRPTDRIFWRMTSPRSDTAEPDDSLSATMPRRLAASSIGTSSSSLSLSLPSVDLTTVCKKCVSLCSTSVWQNSSHM